MKILPHLLLSDRDRTYHLYIYLLTAVLFPFDCFSILWTRMIFQSKTLRTTHHLSYLLKPMTYHRAQKIHNFLPESPGSPSQPLSSPSGECSCVSWAACITSATSAHFILISTTFYPSLLFNSCQRLQGLDHGRTISHWGNLYFSVH